MGGIFASAATASRSRPSPRALRPWTSQAKLAASPQVLIPWCVPLSEARAQLGTYVYPAGSTHSVRSIGNPLGLCHSLRAPPPPLAVLPRGPAPAASPHAQRGPPVQPSSCALASQQIQRTRSPVEMMRMLYSCLGIDRQHRLQQRTRHP